MNKLYLKIICGLMSVGACSAQLITVKPTLTEKPAAPFSNRIPNGTSWVVIVKQPSELREFKPGAPQKDSAKVDAPDKFTDATIRQIENSYNAGIRREILHYADGSQLTRYVKKGTIIFEHPTTRIPNFDEIDASTTGPTTGCNTFEEFSWVTDKYYIGVASYQGKTCFVYRQFFPEVISADNNVVQYNPNLLKGVAFSELKNPANAKIQATAFIDKETMLPVAYDSNYELRIYDTKVAYAPFAFPASIQEAIKIRDEAMSRLDPKNFTRW
jgi:hypothetical protein